MEDGVFFETCYDALDHWDDEWVVCPVCSGRVLYEVGDEGEAIVKVAHLKYNDTKH